MGTGWFYQVAGACIFLLALFILFVVPCVIPDYYRLGLTFLCDSRSEREGFLTGPARDTELTDCRDRAEPCGNQPPVGRRRVDGVEVDAKIQHKGNSAQAPRRPRAPSTPRRSGPARPRPS